MNKKINLAIIMSIAFLVSCIKIYKPEQEIGKSVSMFELQTFNGETVSPCSMKGREVVLVFSRTRLHSQSVQEILQRLDLSYKRFFDHFQK